jgi:uncharacterized protein Yka (UPF0111/DUF47 family)
VTGEGNRRLHKNFITPIGRELIKQKATCEHLESISDCREDVADMIEGVVLEKS